LGDRKAMFVDGRNLNGAEITADVCIIGAGAAGISLAMEFIGHGLSVVLLESGDFDFDDQTQSLAQGENVSFVDFSLESTRLRYFGGTTNHWGGLSYEFSDVDFTSRSRISVPGWPIPLREIAAYYPRAGAYCQLDPMDFRDTDGWQRRAGYAPLRFDQGPMVPTVAPYSPPTRLGRSTGSGCVKPPTSR
jgi:choline dehydrogenase-like flavoprotein